MAISGAILYVPARGIGDFVFSLPLLNSIHEATGKQIEIPIPNRDSLKQMIDMVEFASPTDTFLPKPSEDPLAMKRWEASSAGNIQEKYRLEKKIFEKYLSGDYDLVVNTKPFQIKSVGGLQVSRKDLGLVDVQWGEDHRVDSIGKFAEYMGIPLSLDFSLSFGDSQTAPISNRPYIIFNLGASTQNKRWGAENYTELSRWANEHGMNSVLVGTPEEYHEAQTIQENGCGIINMVSRDQLVLGMKDYARIASDATAVVGSDSGLLHLADAVGAKAIGLYGPTNPQVYGPYHNLNRVVSRHNADKDVSQIQPKNVIKKLEEVL